MAEKLDRTKTQKGYLIRVKNEEKKPTESKEYYALKVEDPNGKNERWILLTGSDVKQMKTLSIEKLLDNIKLGRLYKAQRGTKDFFIVKIMMSGEERIVTISVKAFSRALERAIKNKEDIPHQTKLSNLLD